MTGMEWHAMVLEQTSERHRIEEALAAGRLTVADEHGFLHGIYAICPQDGIRAYPHRTVRAHDVQGYSFAQIIVRCFSCGRSWPATADNIYLS
jgi:hypothetical protein